MNKSIKECCEEKGRMHWCGKHQQDLRLCHQEKEWKHDCKKIGCDMGKDHGLFPIPAPQEKKWYNISDKLKEEVENSPLLDFDTQEESWEEQLEELNKKHGYHMTDMGPARWEVLKNFISNLLQKAREEGQKDTLFSYFGKSTFEIVQALKSADTLASLRESIEGMKLYAYTDAEIAPSYPMETSYLKGHNKALQDIIKLLENKE